MRSYGKRSGSVGLKSAESRTFSQDYGPELAGFHLRWLSDLTRKQTPRGWRNPVQLQAAVPQKSKGLKKRQFSCNILTCKKTKQSTSRKHHPFRQFDPHNEYLLPFEHRDKRRPAKKIETNPHPLLTKKAYPKRQSNGQSSTRSKQIHAAASTGYLQKIDKLIETDRQKELLRQQEISNVDNRHAIRLQRLHDIQRAQTLVQIESLKMYKSGLQRRFNLSERRLWLN